jgi:hypothetical protein
VVRNRAARTAGVNKDGERSVPGLSVVCVSWSSLLPAHLSNGVAILLISTGGQPTCTTHDARGLAANRAPDGFCAARRRLGLAGKICSRHIVELQVAGSVRALASQMIGGPSWNAARWPSAARGCSVPATARTVGDGLWRAMKLSPVQAGRVWKAAPGG